MRGLRLIKRLLTDDRAKLALASALIQVANFLVLLAAKSNATDEQFAFLLTQLAIAGIVGAICSMRLEVLVYQTQKAMTRAALFLPVAAAAIVTGLSFGVYGIVSAIWQDAPVMSFVTIPMMMGLGISAVQNFVFVQVQRLNLLLAARLAQTFALLLLMISLVGNWWSLSGSEILFMIGMAYLVPAAISLLLYAKELPAKGTEHPAFFLPDWMMLKRSLSLTVSTGVNAVYVNLPLLAAAATQSPSFVADFGLIMRAFTAPTTLIGQVIGRLFLAEAMRWSIKPNRTAKALTRPISRTIVQSVGLYILSTPVLIGLFYLYRDALSFSHLGIAPYLFMAGLCQCAVNPISQVRLALTDERAFLLFDVMRLFALMVGVYGLATLIPFEIAFSMTAVTLYVMYIGFIFLRVSRYTPV
jgi:hypothetical protein